ncbi:MAG TPA: ABC transporter substrate-binding protein [Syntrophobacteria bacterium]|nr:ABC transporter substrate-binding protein [Syntrophobacteria bacterium]
MKKLLFVLVLGMCFVLACQREPSQTPGVAQSQPKRGGTYRAALPWQPRNLDPAFSTDIYSVTIIQQIFDGLVQFDRNLYVVPALASSWTVSSDGLVYTFTLRRDVRFHNGRSVTASDFVYSFTRILAPQEDSSALSFFERIQGADIYRRGKARTVSGLTAPDPYTLQIALKEPFSPFLSILAMKSSKVVPREEVERLGKDFGHHPVGTGAFRLHSFQGDRIVLTANPDYFEGAPYLEEVVYSIYPGAQTEKIAEEFLAGRLEESPFLKSIQEKIPGKDTYQLVRKPSLSLMFYGMNCASEPLTDLRVRQAIACALNKDQIIQEVYRDQFVPAKTMLPPGMTGYTPENAVYDYDPEKARKLLVAAGYGSSSKRLSLTLLSASKSTAAQRELALIGADLAKVGIDLQVQYETDWPAFEAALTRDSLQLYRYAWFADIPDPDNFLGILCGSGSRYNFMRYRNPDVDRLLSQALRETDLLKRVTLYREAERIILAQAPMVPWIYLTLESVFQPYVKGLEISALGQPYIPLKKIWLYRE